MKSGPSLTCTWHLASLWDCSSILARLLLRVWERFFSGLPPWTLSLGILVAGLAPPLTWMLNRPEVYEAALAAGQFFLLCGLYLCYSVLEGMRRVVPRLALASGCLGLAIGCRTSEAIPAGFIAIVMVVLILLRQRPRAFAWRCPFPYPGHVRAPGRDDPPVALV